MASPLIMGIRMKNFFLKKKFSTHQSCFFHPTILRAQQLYQKLSRLSHKILCYQKQCMERKEKTMIWLNAIFFIHKRNFPCYFEHGWRQQTTCVCTVELYFLCHMKVEKNRWDEITSPFFTYTFFIHLQFFLVNLQFFSAPSKLLKQQLFSCVYLKYFSSSSQIIW